MQEDAQEAAKGGHAGALPRHVSHQGTLSRLVKGKNINEISLLATDYLNHFNEIIMVLELLPDMPDCLDEAQGWAPKSYTEHFQDSAFADKDLAVLAYENAPIAYRQPFDATVDNMNKLVEKGLIEIAETIEKDDNDALRCRVEGLTSGLRRLIDVASAIIHGNQQTVDQGEIDRIMSF